jgi:hypothetical protein
MLSKIVKKYRQIFSNYHPTPWWDISRLIAPVFSVAGGDDTASPRREGIIVKIFSKL